MTVAPVLDDTGRTFLVVGYGSDAAPVCRGWAAEAERLGKPVDLRLRAFADGPALAGVDALLGAATVGARLYVAGPGRDVRRTLALARRAGLLPSEVSEVVLADHARDVFCPHCAATTETTSGPGETVVCGGCHRTLEIRAHVASWTGTFLGSGSVSEPQDGAHTLTVPSREDCSP